MRTNAVIDDLTDEALKVSRQKQKNAVGEGLKIISSAQKAGKT